MDIYCGNKVVLDGNCRIQSNEYGVKKEGSGWMGWRRSAISGLPSPAKSSCHMIGSTYEQKKRTEKHGTQNSIPQPRPKRREMQKERKRKSGPPNHYPITAVT